MATIVERTILGETDKRIVLTREQMGRTISVGSNWNAIRIGFRHSLTINNANGVVAPGIWAFGLCSGTEKMMQDDTTKHFVGIITSGEDYYASNFSSANNIRVGSSYSTAYNISKKVNLIYTNAVINHGDSGSYSSSYNFLTSSTNTIGMGAWIFEIRKGNPNWNFKVYSPSWRYSSNNNGNVDYNKFINAINNTNINTSNYYFYYTATATLPVDEIADGYLDTINIAWQSVTESLEVSDVAYAILE